MWSLKTARIYSHTKDYVTVKPCTEIVLITYSKQMYQVQL